MKSQISGDTEFEAFFQHIEDRQEAVGLQNPYTDIQIVPIAKNLIESPGFTQWTAVNVTEQTRRRKLG